MGLIVARVRVMVRLALYVLLGPHPVDQHDARHLVGLGLGGLGIGAGRG